MTAYHQHDKIYVTWLAKKSVILGYIAIYDLIGWEESNIEHDPIYDLYGCNLTPNASFC